MHAHLHFVTCDLREEFWFLLAVYTCPVCQLLGLQPQRLKLNKRTNSTPFALNIKKKVCHTLIGDYLYYYCFPRIFSEIKIDLAS